MIKMKVNVIWTTTIRNNHKHIGVGLCHDCKSNLYNAELFLYKQWRLKSTFEFEIIINVLVSSFRFICVPMIWVYGHYKFFNFSVRGSILNVYRRQMLTSKVSLRTERVKYGGLNHTFRPTYHKIYGN